MGVRSSSFVWKLAVQAGSDGLLTSQISAVPGVASGSGSAAQLDA
jgi:hypothetical protein